MIEVNDACKIKELTVLDAAAGLDFAGGGSSLALTLALPQSSVPERLAGAGFAFGSSSPSSFFAATGGGAGAAREATGGGGGGMARFFSLDGFSFQLGFSVIPIRCAYS